MDWKYLYGSFDGRIGRQSFWIGHVVLIAISAAVHVVVGGIFGMEGIGRAIAGIITLVLIYPSLAVDVKRLHDRGKTGWWILLLLVPIVGFIWFVVELGCLRGTAGANRYGEDPLPAPVAA